MKKLAYFLALFVGLNATAVVRKPEEEENQAIIVKDASRQSTAAWIQRIGKSLKACYYGITKDGFIHELGWEIIHKIKRTDLSNNQNANSQISTNKALNNNQKGKLIWIHFTHVLENGNESWELNLFVKKDNEWECFTELY